MDYIWTPWRYQYMKQVEAGQQPECIFCDAASRTDDCETLVAYRGAKIFVILNRFPYTSGHVMIVPYAHVGDLGSCDPEALSEMMKLAQRVGRHEPGYEPWPSRWRGRGWARSLARFAAMVWRFQFHDRHRRDARASRRFANHVRALA
jgi:hypothetical protein